jgi:ABC-type sugar transport system substrate-binding protein
MKSAILIALFAATLAFASARPIVEIGENTTAYYVVKGIRGFWTGYNQGFYKDAKKDIDCLNEPTT